MGLFGKRDAVLRNSALDELVNTFTNTIQNGAFNFANQLTQRN
jgi:hypothetical protein